MAAPSVTFDGTRVSSANSVTDGGNWDKWDASQNPAVEPDVRYEGANAISNKVGTAAGGVELGNSTGTHDLATTPKVILYKCIATNNAALNVIGSTGMIHYIGSGTTTDRYEYYTHGSDAYPLAGGWVFDLIDPNIVGYSDVTAGSPDLTLVNYWAVSADFTATSKVENVAMDAIDYFDVGTGLTMDDGVGDECAFEDFRVFEEDTITERHGIFRSVEGIFYVLGMLTIGTATETDFTDDTGGTMVFSDGLFGLGTSGIVIDIQHNTSVFSCTGWSFVGNGDTTTDDSRPSITVTGAGTSASASLDGCSFRNFTDATFTTDCVISSCKFSLVDQVDAGNGANLSNSSVLVPSTAANASAVLWDNTLDSDGLLDGMTFSKGTNDHHAIEFGDTVPISLTLNNCDFTGFSASQDVNSSIFHFKDVGGTTITLNLVGCTSDVAFASSYRTDGATIIVVEDPVTLTVNTIDSGGDVVGSARVFVKASDGTGPLPYQDVVTITAITTTATVAHTSHGLTTGHKVLIEGVANDEDYNGIKTIIVTTASEYTYTVSTSPASPATGSPTSTGVVISALSNGSGVALDTRTYGSDQPIVGWSRKGSSSPYYKEGAITGAISSTSGLITNAVMILDE
jgi:hypothetical protein